MIPVVDLFAGPGGLNEGFSRVRGDDGQPVFKTVASFEMDPWAVKTLRLRTAFRELTKDGPVPEYLDLLRGELTLEEFCVTERGARAWRLAEGEVHEHRLNEETRSVSDGLIRAALKEQGALDGASWILIGGPPCQAYSLAGRSRRTNDKTFEQDEKHFLFKEYLHIIEEFAPTIFVMENVKGLLSSTHSGRRMFDAILTDLSSPKTGLEYDIRSLVVQGNPATLKPEDFVIRAEEYGIPQRRHRVILLGIRKGAIDTTLSLLQARPSVTVRDAIGDLPKIRSALSPRSADTFESWKVVREIAQALAGGRPKSAARLTTGGPFAANYSAPESKSAFLDWVLDPMMHGVTLHEARSHMKEDLKRYGYLARRARKLKQSPKLGELPKDLLPAHKNVDRSDTPFTDRFRVQLWDAPSTTIVSHIAKDGHYYIHPDADQMRSLTVREAARLQTFPDDYFFIGGRTQQYHQVGNAVPPLLAFHIAEEVARLLGLTPRGLIVAQRA